MPSNTVAKESSGHDVSFSIASRRADCRCANCHVYASPSHRRSLLTCQCKGGEAVAAPNCVNGKLYSAQNEGCGTLHVQEYVRDLLLQTEKWVTRNQICTLTSSRCLISQKILEHIGLGFAICDDTPCGFECV
jgi:hypothetical protein